ncbi:MAG: hypothetical protein HFJ02_02815 [Bacilli bacterium]|nr:hypothetical protein [Bacilli bacterium]
MKRFKTKRRLKFRYKLTLNLIIVLITFVTIFKFLYNKFLIHMDNEHLINYLVDYNLNTKKNHPLIYDLMNLNSTDFLLKYTLGVETSKDEEPEEKVGFEVDYVEDPYKTDIKEPILYIYNTHQTEGYQKTNNASYNITPSVLMASYILRESLNDLGIPALVETNDISEILKVHNWKYSYSYAASKLLMKDAMEKNPTLTYFIDLHRDATSYEASTTTIENKKYAKILFVIGKDHPNYEKNLKFANTLNDYLKKNYPTLTRGLAIKSGKGVNGIYNQDMSENAILIELGGQYNSIVEVNNTITILTKALYAYIKGEL